MSHTQIIALMSIILGGLIAGNSLRVCLTIIIQMFWLNAQLLHKIANKEEVESTKFKFSSFTMYVAGCGPFIGLALILGGIKYL